jgi:nucleoid-associated protein YgaU
MEKKVIFMSKIINKNYKSYDRISRYASFPYYYNKADNKYMYGLTTHLKKKNISYVLHIVQDNDTLDSLALYYYNNPTYFWAIADFNNIQDPYIDLSVGMKLKIPTFSNIEFDI